ncbi:MAG: asparagine synthase (glutamine-hydrolyzing) [Candidatus Latescibacterota bacterium]
MCGIVGRVSRRPAAAGALEEAAREALATIAYRGPDDWGVATFPGVVLGAVRLAIIDREGGHQPMRDPDTGVCLVYNGMIYNYPELRAELEHQGHRFRTRSDTEVLLRGYLEHGAGVVERLNGMFAFAVYDPRAGSLLCARDPLGIKPLYYRSTAAGLAFASEVKALLALDGAAAEPEPQAIADYVHLQYALGDKTFFRGVRKLLPGCCLEVEVGGEMRLRTYWEPEPTEAFSGSFEEAAARLRALLERAVSWQQRADVPLGAHLSGGIDTASVCALAAAGGSRLQCFTGAFREGGVFDDSEAAALTARHVGAEHSVVWAHAQDFADAYESLVYHLDEPVAAPGVFAQYAVSRLARQRVTVVLGGQGADEVLGGYTRYYLLLLDQALRQGAGQGSERLGLGWDELGGGLPQLHQYGGLWQTLEAGRPFANGTERYWSLIDRAEGIAEGLCPEFVGSLEGYRPYDAYAEVLGRHAQAELLNRVLYYETTCWLPALLQVEDRMSMACSLESRVPILDRDVVDFAFSLPTAVKMRGAQTKAVLRQACADLLPPAIAQRRDKLGFPVPVNQWFTGPLRSFVADILGSRAAGQRGVFRPEVLQVWQAPPAGAASRLLWGLLNVELWFRCFVDGNGRPVPAATSCGEAVP